jgi:hypothetical protein
VSTPALPNTPALPKVARSPVDTSAVTGALPALPALPVAVPALPVDLPALPARDVDHPTLPEVFKAVVLKVNPIADKLSALSILFLVFSCGRYLICGPLC